MTRKNPYIGPRAFQLDDKDLFRGRDQEVQKLVDLLIAERIVLLHAPSGAGKTSLLNAAVLPALEEEDFLVLPVMRVSRLLPEKILKDIKVKNRYVFSALLSLEQFQQKSSESDELTDEELTRLKKLASMTFLEYLKEEIPKRQSEQTGPSEMVLIFDQFEEILSVDSTDSPEKEKFFKQLGDALYTDKYWALFSMREDYVASLGSLLRPLPTRLATRFKLNLLTEEKAYQAIREPAQTQQVTFKDEAVKKLVDDLRTVKVLNLAGDPEEKQGDFIEPMQLQVVCYRLWEKLPLPADGDETFQITMDHLKGTHVNQALADFYDDCLTGVTAMPGARKEEELRQWIEDQLITPGGTRGMVFMSKTEAAGMPRAMVEGLAARHLLRGEDRAGAKWYELTHDRFIEPIKESNRPWAWIRLAARRATRAHVVAIILFVVLALFWLGLEFFVTKPVREAQAVIAARELNKQEGQRAEELKVLVMDAIKVANDQTNWRPVSAAIDRNISDAEAQLQVVKGKRPTKDAQRKLRELTDLKYDFDKAYALCSLRFCVKLANALQTIKQASTNNWTNFRLTDDEIESLGELSKYIPHDSRPIDERTIPSITPDGRSAIVEAGNTSVADSVSKPAKKSGNKPHPSSRQLFDAAIKKLNTARTTRNWTKARLDSESRVLETAGNAELQRIFAPLRKWSERYSARESWLKAQDAIRTDPTTPTQRRVSGQYQSLFFSYTVRPEMMTLLLYSVWSVFLLYYLRYSIAATRIRTEGVAVNKSTFARAGVIRDPLAWNISEKKPSITTIIALSALLLIHLRVSWICLQVLRSSGSTIHWTLLTLPFVLVIAVTFFYLLHGYRYGRSYQTQTQST